MKRMICAVMALLLTGCAAGQVRSSAPVTDGQPAATPETAATAETAESAATPAPTTAPPQGLVPTDADVLDYDDIRLIAYERAFQPYPETDYYTMCKDGLWGLMRSDGTEVLPCRAPQPLVECFIEGRRWHGYQDNLPWDEMLAEEKRINVLLRESGDGMLCAAHDGGTYLEFVYLTDYKVYTYSGSMGPGELAAPTDEDMLLYSGRVDGYVPVQTGVTEDEGDDHVSIISDGQYIYRRRNGSAANIYHYTLADYFFDATLAPAEREGKWVYLGTMGEEVTPVCYDSVYYTNTSGDGSFLFRRAAPLLNGYTPVSRSGKFGLLDRAGAEYVPCTYDGLVWDGGTAWVKLDDGWHQYTIPGVTKPDPLDDLPEDITAPDTRTFSYARVITEGGRLNLRAGPGTEYDIVGKIPEYTSLRIYGSSNTAPAWVLVQYQGQFGWTNLDYLERSY